MKLALFSLSSFLVAYLTQRGGKPGNVIWFVFVSEIHFEVSSKFEKVINPTPLEFPIWSLITLAYIILPYFSNNFLKSISVKFKGKFTTNKVKFLPWLLE